MEVRQINVLMICNDSDLIYSVKYTAFHPCYTDIHCIFLAQKSCVVRETDTL